jgi:hypothetical protein
VADEDYYFACERARLDDAPLADVLALLRDADYRAGVARLDGYDPAESGTLVGVADGLAGTTPGRHGR